jgi:DNA-binding beta-propeller fold protein YncE
MFSSASMHRRDFGRIASAGAGGLVVATAATSFSGCEGSKKSVQTDAKVWGQVGIVDGRFFKPRAVALSEDHEIFIVDLTGRIQVFNSQGEFLRGWRTPEVQNGRPTGMCFDRHGRLMVADTHYYRILYYTPQGELLDKLQIGGKFGREPGEFGLVTHAVEDKDGNFYVSEYGDNDRIQKLTPDREVLCLWGSHGDEPGHFMRPQSLLLDENDHLWIADACNHRIQVFDATTNNPKQVAVWGEMGTDPGKLRYPYDMAFDGAGHLLVCEWGNHRISKFTLDGKFVDSWGSYGQREPGQLSQPWGFVREENGMLHILDSINNRVQSVKFG